MIQGAVFAFITFTVYLFTTSGYSIYTVIPELRDESKLNKITTSEESAAEVQAENAETADKDASDDNTVVEDKLAEVHVDTETVIAWYDEPNYLHSFAVTLVLLIILAFIC